MTSNPKPTDLLPVDWVAIEPHHRAGIRSLASIGKEFGVTPAAILKHAKKHGWTRDLTARIQAKARDKVAAAVAQEAVNAAAVNDPGKRATETSIIGANADVLASVQIAHRQDIKRARGLVQNLTAELEGIGDQPELMAQMVDALSTSDEASGTVLAKIAEFVSSLPQRVKTTKDLIEALRVAIAMEREAFGLNDGQPPPSAPDSFEALADLIRDKA